MRNYANRGSWLVLRESKQKYLLKKLLRPVRNVIWDNILKNGTSKICGTQPSKICEVICDCLPQILRGQFLNTLFHVRDHLSIFPLGKLVAAIHIFSTFISLRDHN